MTYLFTEDQEIKNEVGNPISISKNTTVNSDSNPIFVKGTSDTSFFSPTQSDAFGRLRTSDTYTLFDSSHRFADNDLWAESTTGTASSSFSSSEGLINLSVGTSSGDEILRETYKVFSYQPGKSLLILNTFVLSPAKTNLRQRVGYFGAQNGMFLELDSSTLSFVERSLVTGSVTETKIAKENWNIDTLDGTGPSGITLDITKAQIMWMDIEWLGLGTVRMGFVIDGVFIHCHSFHHANLITSTYITTASLPLRMEITNTGETSSSSTAKQICNSVMSEGGYQLTGLQQGVGTPVTTPRVSVTAGTYLPIISLRLKSARIDAIAILSALSFVGTGNGINYNWQIRSRSVTTGGTWISAGSNSSVEYNLTGTSTSGGRILAQGFQTSTNQSSSPTNLLKEALFVFQFERDSFTGTAYEITLMVAADNPGYDMYATMDWEEVTR